MYQGKDPQVSQSRKACNPHVSPEDPTLPHTLFWFALKSGIM